MVNCPCRGRGSRIGKNFPNPSPWLPPRSLQRRGARSRPRVTGYFFKYRQADTCIRPIVMEPSPDNSQRNASQSPSVGASALEASTTPNHPTQACARSRSTGRNGTVDGSGAVDDRRPQRLRQPAIDAAPMDASAVEASTAPPTNYLRGDVPACAPRASSVASADSQANSNPLDEWNARLNSYGGYGGGVVALEASRGFQSQGQQQWAAQPYGYGGYGIQAGYSQAQYYGGSSQQQPPYGHRYTDTSGSHWMWNPYNCSYMSLTWLRRRQDTRCHPTRDSSTLNQRAS